MKKVLFILSELSTRDIDWLLAHGDPQKVPEGTVLIHEGQPLNALYIVLDGILTVSVAGLGNREVAKIGCGEVLGEMSFVDGSPPSATVKAIEDSLVLAINQKKLSQKLEEDVLFALRFYQAITKFLSYRLRGTFQSFSKKESSQQQNNGLDDAEDVLGGANLAMAKAKFERLIQGVKQGSTLA
jgi:CRP-like cAMP-binding protein